jgi:signal transduction histidine kinase
MAVESSIAAPRRVPRVKVARLGVSTLTIALLAAALAFAGHRLAMPADGSEIGGPGNPYAQAGGAIAVTPGLSGATTLRAGDRVVAIFGRPVDAWAAGLLDPTVPRPVIAVGDPIGYTVERNGRPIGLSVMATRFDGIATLAQDWGVLVLALSIQLVGAYLFARRPDEPAARALLVAGTGMFASTVPWALGAQVTDIVTATGFWLYAATAGVAYVLFWCGALHFALVFPRPYPFAVGGRRVLAIAYGIPMGAMLALIIGTLIATGRVLPALAAWIDGQATLQVVVIVAAIALMTYSYARHVDPDSRLQLRLVAGAAGLAAVTGLVLWFGPELILGAPLVPPSAVALLGLPFPIALVLAINRHHLFDLDTVVNRSLVYGGLTGGVVVTYAATVAFVGGLIPGNAPFAVALLGTGAVAVVALPLRDRLQRSVNRVMYGDRDEPDSALRRLGRRLEASLDPPTVLPTLVDAVADSLRAPYVAIELEHDGEARVEASHGAVPVDARGLRELVRVPIVYRGRQVGRLVLAPRAADEPFSGADGRLLADLARQAAPAIEAIRLMADLRRSHEELVATREEERRRLRRDLHDELGPAMAGSLMKLGAARSIMVSDPTRASTLLDGVDTDVRGMIDEIRRIAHNLRPSALDEFGLLGTLRMQIATFDEGPADRRLRVWLTAPDELPPLPAAVEVAALRIALEALTNAARHSGASQARVEVALNGHDLNVTVNDDGIGIPGDASPGVGLTSMRERATELGGRLDILPAEGGGTTVTARLPVVPDEPS